MSLSKEFALSFFPATIGFVSNPELAPAFLYDAWSAVFPDDDVNLCGFPPLTLPYLPQRPTLALACVVGAFIGFRFGADRRAVVERDTQSIEVDSIRRSWSNALTAYGAMNIFALLHHCILPPPASYENASEARKAFDATMWAGDCIATGISGIHIAIIALLLYGIYGRKKYTQATIRRQELAVYALLTVMVAPIPLIFQHLVYGEIDVWRAGSAFIEFIYVIPVIVGSAWLFPHVVDSALKRGFCNQQSAAGARIALAGVTLAVAIVPFDSTMCRTVLQHAPALARSPLLYDIFHLPTIFFAGCTIAMVGLDVWVRGIAREIAARREKEK